MRKKKQEQLYLNAHDVQYMGSFLLSVTSVSTLCSQTRVHSSGRVQSAVSKCYSDRGCGEKTVADRNGSAQRECNTSGLTVP